VLYLFEFYFLAPCQYLRRHGTLFLPCSVDAPSFSLGDVAFYSSRTFFRAAGRPFQKHGFWFCRNLSAPSRSGSRSFWRSLWPSIFLYAAVFSFDPVVYSFRGRR